jgi:D-alanine-D-alanine ligase
MPHNNHIHTLLLFGGGSSEHEISQLSANFIRTNLDTLQDVSVSMVEITDSGWTNVEGKECYLDIHSQELVTGDLVQKVDYVIPCIHGYPGETGDIQSLLELAKIPYLGCGPQASTLSFNKISSKLWYDALGVANTPYLFINELNESTLNKATQAFEQWGGLFVKAACQGSSVGCYAVTNSNQIESAITQAFQYSNQVLIEKMIKPREIELAAYEINGELKVSYPGEVKAPDDTFYTYEEKYGNQSHSTTDIRANNITDEQVSLMQRYTEIVFKQMKLKDLSRVDFFLTAEGEVFLNEVNTFPGMTPISMFPKMLEANGDQFALFLNHAIKNATKEAIKT